jgi:hypothetical protein
VNSVKCGGVTATCQYDASPDVALATVCAHEGPLLVDFDETPGLLALLLLRMLDVLKPWLPDWWHRYRTLGGFAPFQPSFPGLAGAGARTLRSLLSVMSIKNLRQHSKRGRTGFKSIVASHMAAADRGSLPTDVTAKCARPLRPLWPHTLSQGPWWRLPTGEYISKIKRPGSATSFAAYSRRISFSGC